MNDLRDLVSSPFRPRTRAAYLQSHNLSEVAFRLSDIQDFPGYAISIGGALTFPLVKDTLLTCSRLTIVTCHVFIGVDESLN